jgi:hypothetical protein
MYRIITFNRDEIWVSRPRNSTFFKLPNNLCTTMYHLTNPEYVPHGHKIQNFSLFSWGIGVFC